MAQEIDKILGSEVLSEDVKSSITEAWNTKLSEAREQITAELREEFANRYEDDKSKIVEAMDSKLSDTIKAELTEFAQDKNKLAEDRVAYKKAIGSHAKVLEKFVMDVLKKEITELREDREAQKTNFGKLEGFVLGQLTKELNEFHEDRRSLVEQKVKMVKEGKKVIEEAKGAFVKNAAKKVEKIMAESIRGELTTLKEDIQIAKENDFGRKIFETFAAEFMTSTLSEGTEVSRLSRKISSLSKKLAESEQTITEKDKAIMEASRKAAIASDLADRKSIMSEMMSPLNGDQKQLMSALLEGVKTNKLRVAYDKYLPNVLNEDTSKVGNKNKAQLTESTASKVITGDKAKAQPEVGESADIIEIKKLAGIR